MQILDLSRPPNPRTQPQQALDYLRALIDVIRLQAGAAPSSSAVH